MDSEKIPSIIQRPETCPCCNEPISRKELLKGESVDWYCVNSECSGIKYEKIKGFIGTSKRGMGILGIGEHLIRHLIDSGRVNNITDLYSITEDELQIMPLGNGVVGSKRAATIVANIQASKSVPVERVIGSLGVDGLGEHRAEIMMEVARNIPISLNVATLDTMNDWVEVAKGSKLIMLLRHPHLPENIMISVNQQLYEMKDTILKLQELGVGINKPVESTKASDNTPKPFNGLSFCFTGTRQYTDVVESLGGKIASGVSKGTDYLIQKDKDQVTSKSKKATSLGTKILGLSELEAMINDVAPNCLEVV